MELIMEPIAVLLYILVILLVISIFVSVHILIRSSDILDELKEITDILKRMENK